MRNRLETDKRPEPLAPTAWRRETPCTCLRLEPSATEAHLFPYQHFVTASLVQADADEVLRLTFSSHDVEITGRCLRELLVAIQDFAVKCVRVVPERYRGVAAADAGLVLGIRITPAK